MKPTVRSTLAELHQELRRRGLPTHGSKMDLLARLHAPLEGGSSAAAASSAAAPGAAAAGEASPAAAHGPIVAAPDASAQASAGGLAAYLAPSDSEGEQPPPAPPRKRLRRLVSAEVAAPEAAPEDGAGAVIARLADGQRDELVVRQLKRLEPGTYARLLREGAAHLSREEIRAAQGAADVRGAQVGRATRSRDA